jgi:hypothetical protein
MRTPKLAALALLLTGAICVSAHANTITRIHFDGVVTETDVYDPYNEFQPIAVGDWVTGFIAFDQTGRPLEVLLDLAGLWLSFNNDYGDIIGYVAQIPNGYYWYGPEGSSNLGHDSTFWFTLLRHQSGEWLAAGVNFDDQQGPHQIYRGTTHITSITVPEGGSTLALLGLALIGMAFVPSHTKNDTRRI